MDGRGSMLFILCGNIVKLYIYLCMYSNFVTNIFMGLKIRCQVGESEYDFQN